MRGSPRWPICQRRNGDGRYERAPGQQDRRVVERGERCCSEGVGEVLARCQHRNAGTCGERVARGLCGRAVAAPPGGTAHLVVQLERVADRKADGVGAAQNDHVGDAELDQCPGGDRRKGRFLREQNWRVVERGEWRRGQGIREVLPRCQNRHVCPGREGLERGGGGAVAVGGCRHRLRRGWSGREHYAQQSKEYDDGVARVGSHVVKPALTGVDDQTVCTITVQVEKLGRLVDALRATSAAEIADRSRHELGSKGLSYRLGHRRPVHLIEQLTRVSQAEAARRIRLGSAVRPRLALDGRPFPAAFPLVAPALTAGQLGLDAAAGIIRCLGQAAGRHANMDDLNAAEQSLVDTAAVETADMVGLHARVWREALDPDGAEPREEVLRARRRFSLGREVDGMTPFSGALDPASAAVLRAAFSDAAAPGATPRFLSEEDIARGTHTSTNGDGDGDGEEVITMCDPRTREQRQHDVVIGLLTAGIRASERAPAGMRSLATVMAVIQLKDLESGTGVGWLDDVAEPVSAVTVGRMACDGGHQKIVLGDDGEVLHPGRPERLFSTAQRTALAVRNGACVIHCGAPPGWCDAHHVTEYEAGGETNVDNGVLLCGIHHTWLHASGFTLKMVNGKP